jgi:hypothetical protein
VDKKMKVKIMIKEDMSDLKVHCITSEVGKKSGINSAQNTWTGSLKIWSWNSCHQELKVG